MKLMSQNEISTKHKYLMKRKKFHLFLWRNVVQKKFWIIIFLRRQFVPFSLQIYLMGVLMFIFNKCAHVPIFFMIENYLILLFINFLIILHVKRSLLEDWCREGRQTFFVRNCLEKSLMKWLIYCQRKSDWYEADQLELLGI